MAQQSHVTVGTTPVDLTDGLSPGRYLAQARAPGDEVLLLATADTAPADDADWFLIAGGEFFTFVVSDAEPPTWAKDAVGLSTTVSIARERQ